MDDAPKPPQPPRRRRRRSRSAVTTGRRFFLGVDGTSTGPWARRTHRPPPEHQVSELFVAAGRRSGKSRMSAALSIYLALFRHHRLAAGERGHVLIIAPTQQQARIAKECCEAFLQESPILRHYVSNVTATEIELTNRVVIGVHAASFRSVR